MDKKENSNVWMVRSGEGGYLIEEFLEQNIVSIGWNDLGELKANLTYEDLKALIATTYDHYSPGAKSQTAGQIWRFLNEFKIGDRVITYDSNTRLYYLGEIKSSYKYSDKLSYYHYRTVEWMDAGIERDSLSTETKNTLGSALTIFSVTEPIWNELRHNHPSYISEEQLHEIEEIQKELETQALAYLKEDVISKSSEFTKDIISNLTWQDTERLVSGLLRALGYKTQMTSRGSDLGSDIIASYDELGLQEPIIKVEVKKRSKEKISSEQIRSFIGGLRGYNKGIYVTTSGFTKDAKYDAERANFAITLIDADRLVDLIVSNYDALDIETKALVPLRKIYWPV